MNGYLTIFSHCFDSKPEISVTGNAALPFFSHPSTCAICLFIISFFSGCFDNFVISNYIDLVPNPNLQGFVFGTSNTVATIPGFLGPFLVTFSLSQFHGSWYPIFWLMSLVLVLAGLNYYKNADVAKLSLGENGMIETRRNVPL